MMFDDDVCWWCLMMMMMMMMFDDDHHHTSWSFLECNQDSGKRGIVTRLRTTYCIPAVYRATHINDPLMQERFQCTTGGGVGSHGLGERLWTLGLMLTRWWFLQYFLFSPRKLGKWSNLTIFSTGLVKNHHLVEFRKIHPQSLTWEPENDGFQVRNLNFQTLILRFHVKLQGRTRELQDFS